MKKLLLVAMMLCVINCAFTQNSQLYSGQSYYYYQGKKFYIQPTYAQVVVGVKKETSFGKNKAGFATQVQVAPDSISIAATLGEFAVRVPGGQQGGKAFIEAMGKKSFVTYVHPAFTGQGKKLFSYGDGFVVQLKQGISSAQLTSLLTKLHCAIVKRSPGDKNTYLLSAGPQNNYDALQMANTFFETGLFEYAEPNFTTWGGLIDAPNDALYNLQWAHHNTGSPEQYNGIPGADIQVDSAWLTTKGDTSIKIAVIDTGVDSTQADLKKNLIQGYNCVTQTANPGDGAPMSADDAHGTACAGIIGAVANNKIGIAGIAPKCKIMPISITNEFGNFTSDFGIASGIDYAWQNGADVLSNSYTIGTPSGTLDAAIHRAVTQGRGGKGCMVFFGSGNDNAGVSYPASNPEVVAVGGSNMYNQHKTKKSYDGEDWWGANYGGGLDVSAPCVKIATTDITGEHGINKTAGTDGDYYLIFNGTSAAAPHAASVAALVLSVNKNFTAAEVRNIIESSCTKPAAYNFALTPGNINGTWNQELGYGIVNAYKSVLLAKSKKFCNAGIAKPSTTVLCKNAFIKLGVVDSNATATYSWRLNGTAIQAGNSISISAPGNYDVVATFANGCMAYTAPVTITVADTGVLVANAGEPAFICPGSNGVVIGGAPSAQGGVKFTGGQRAYGSDFLFSSFIRFDIENPRDYKFITPHSLNGVSSNLFVAGDFTPMGYYAINRNGELAKIDTATGDMWLIGHPQTLPGQNLPHKWSGLSWNPVTQKLYGLASGGLANALYEISPVTAKSKMVNYWTNASGSWIAYNNAGTLFGYNGNYNTIGRIFLDKQENILRYTSLTGDIGAYNIAQLDGAVDPLNGKLYYTTYAVGQSLYGDLREVDTVTGKIAVKGDIGRTNEVAGLAISGGVYKYSWAPAAGLSNPNDANPIAKPSATTTYTLTVTDACGATVTSQVVVTANAPKPAVKITASKDSICVDDSSRLTVTANPNYTYDWKYNGFVMENPNDSFLVTQRGGKYEVTITQGAGCVNTARFNLKDCSIWMSDGNNGPTCESYLYPPNGYVDTGFRPNQTFVKTIYPAAAGSNLRALVKSFYTGGPSYFTIYDGPNINSPVLRMFSYYDNNIKNLVFTSTKGPLTFKLASGGNEYDIGKWDIVLTCHTPRVYVSKQSGNYEDLATWKIKTGDNVFEDATEIPTYAEDSIIIRNGHTVSVNSNSNLVNQLYIQKGGKLTLNAPLQLMPGGEFGLVADGDIVINKNGQLYGGANAYIRGNISGVAAWLSVNMFADGKAPQTFSFANDGSFTNGGTIATLNVLNPAGLTIKGITRFDSLFMRSKGGLWTDSIIVQRKLQLDSGIIHIKAPGVADLSYYKIVCSNGNSSSYIDGATSRSPYTSTTWDAFYPIGTANTYRPLYLKFAGYVNDIYTIQSLDQPAPPRPLPVGIDQVSANNYYKVQKLRNYSFVNVAVIMSYYSGDGVTDPANLRIVRDSAGKWYDIGGTGTHADTGTITSTGKLATLGDFALANATGGTNALPVNWLRFSTTAQNSDVLLSWGVAQEINVSNYTVEHSMDGAHFSALALVTANTNNSGNNTYSYLHAKPVPGQHYYRIKETDKDGRFAYTKIAMVKIAGKNSFSATPNPTRDVVNITSGDAIKEIDCYNALGQLIKKIMPAANTYRLSLKQMSAGVYTIKVVTAAGTYNSKVVKE